MGKPWHNSWLWQEHDKNQKSGLIQTNGTKNQTFGGLATHNGIYDGETMIFTEKHRDDFYHNCWYNNGIRWENQSTLGLYLGLCSYVIWLWKLWFTRQTGWYPSRQIKSASHKKQACLDCTNLLLKAGPLCLYPTVIKHGSPNELGNLPARFPHGPMAIPAALLPLCLAGETPNKRR